MSSSQAAYAKLHIIAAYYVVVAMHIVFMHDV